MEMERFIMDKTLKTQSGVSIIEISIAVLIISITTLLIFAFSKNSFLMSKDARSTDIGYIAAEQKIADLKSEVFSSTPATGNDEITLDNIPFSRSWTVEESGYILLAKVTVTWNTPNGTREIILAGAVN
jgi:Tfp pilus assembly protein PilV